MSNSTWFWLIRVTNIVFNSWYAAWFWQNTHETYKNKSWEPCLSWTDVSWREFWKKWGNIWWLWTKNSFIRAKKRKISRVTCCKNFTFPKPFPTFRSKFDKILATFSISCICLINRLPKNVMAGQFILDIGPKSKTKHFFCSVN